MIYKRDWLNILLNLKIKWRYFIEKVMKYKLMLFNVDVCFKWKIIYNFKFECEEFIR